MPRGGHSFTFGGSSAKRSRHPSGDGFRPLIRRRSPDSHFPECNEPVQGCNPLGSQFDDSLNHLRARLADMDEGFSEVVIVHAYGSISLHAPSMHGDETKCPSAYLRPNREHTAENFRA